MKRVGFAVVVLGLLLVAALWVVGGLTRPWIRGAVERQLGHALAVPCRIGTLEWSWRRLELIVGAVRCGDPSPALELDELSVTVELRASLAAWRPIAVVRVERPSLDLTALPATTASPSSSGPLALPPFTLNEVDVHDLRLRFQYDPHNPAEVTIESVHASATAGLTGALAEVLVVGAVFERKGMVVRLHDAYLNGGWNPGSGVYATSAMIEGEGIELDLTDTEKPGVFHAQARFAPEILGAFVDELVFLNGAVSVDGTLSGDLIDPTVSASLFWSGASLAGRPIGDLTTRFVRHGAELLFQDIYISGPAGRLSGNVAMTVRDEVPIQGDVRAEGVRLREVLARSGAAVEFPTILDGHVVLSGQLDPLDLRLSGDGVAQGGPDTKAAAWQAQVNVRPKAVNVTASIEQKPSNRAEVQLSIDGEHFDGRATLKAGDVAALRHLLPAAAANLTLTGKATVEATFAGSPDQPRIALHLDGERLTVMGGAVPRLVGDLEIAAGRLEARDVRVETPGGFLAMDGTLALQGDLPNAFELTIKRFDTDVLMPLLAVATGVQLPVTGGVVNGRISARGVWTDLAADAELRGETWRLVHEPIAAVELRGQVRGRNWKGQLAVQHTSRESLSVAASGSGAESVDLTVDSTPIALGALVGAGQSGLDGSLTIQGRLRGALSQLRGQLNAKVDGLHLRGERLGDFEARVDAGERQWTLNAADTGGRLTLSGVVTPSANLPFSLRGEWKALDLSPFLPAGAGLAVVTSGTMGARGTLSPWVLAAGEMEVPQFDVSRDAYAVRAAAPLRFRLADGTVRIEQFELESGETRLRVAGTLTPDGRVDLEANGKGDMVLLELMGDPVEAARGPFAVAVKVQRDGGDWHLTGTAELDNASADLGLPISFEQTSARIRLQGSQVFVDKLEGRAGGGRFDVHGVVDLRQGPSLEWTLTDVGLNVADGLEARLKAKGGFEGSWEAMVLNGDIEILNALYDKDLELDALLDWLTKKLLPQVEVARGSDLPLRLNLLIYSRGGVYLDNNIAKGEMWLDLQVTGDVAKPQLGGRIGLLDGEVTFRGRTFSITSGSIDFRDPLKINPALNITAESRISTPDADYIVNVIVTGTAEKPRVQFSADAPGMSQNDVLSLVAFGKTGTQLQRESTGFNPAATALALLPTGGVEKRVEQLLGVDRFEVSATQARDTGAIEPRVTVGKDLTDQFRAVVWSSFGVQARQAVQLEYRWTRRVSLLSSWESQTQSSAGAFGGDVKFRFEFRRVPFSVCGSEVPVSAAGFPLREGDAGTQP